MTDSEHKKCVGKNGHFHDVTCLQSPFIDRKNKINILTPSYTPKNHKTIGGKPEPRGIDSLIILNGTEQLI